MPSWRGSAGPALACAFVDTLAMARQRFPGAPASLDALCRRFAIDLSVREKHGADIDCGLLASVYLELLGGRQPALALVADAADAGLDQEQAALRRTPRPAAAAPGDRGGAESAPGDAGSSKIAALARPGSE